MRTTDKERLEKLVEDSVDELDKTTVYDAIAMAERGEQDPATRQLLHEAALELMKSIHDPSHLDRVRDLLAAIKPTA
jgi:hypothetical protein